MCSYSSLSMKPSIPGAETVDRQVGFVPAYLGLHESGELRRRAEALRGMQQTCEVCPRRCRARRVDGEAGFCGASAELEIASYGRHFGEEGSSSPTRSAPVRRSARTPATRRCAPS